MKEEFIGYASTSKIFGFGLFPILKDEVSVAEDIFTREMVKYEDKKIKITVEEVDKHK